MTASAPGTSTFRSTHTTFVVCAYPHAVEIEVHGEYDLSSTSASQLVIEHIGELIGMKPRPVIVDLSAVSFFDAAGVKFLLRVARLAQLADTTARVRNPNANVRRLFDVLDLSNIVESS